VHKIDLIGIATCLIQNFAVAQSALEYFGMVPKHVIQLRYFGVSAWNHSAVTGRMSVKFYIWVLFENLSRIFKFR